MPRTRIRLDEQGRPLPRDGAVSSAPVSVCSCPRLDPADWHDVESDWADIAFVRTHTAALFGVPVGVSGLKAELMSRAAAVGATVPEDAMLLFGEGRFRRPVLLEVEGKLANLPDVLRPGGHVYSRLLAAPFGQVKKIAEETRDLARQRYGRSPDALWLWYITCRECSEERNFETLFLAHYGERR